MWSKNEKGTRRPIRVSQQLYDGLSRYFDDKGYVKNLILEQSIINLSRETNILKVEEGKPSNNEIKKIREILNNHPMPGNKNDMSICFYINKKNHDVVDILNLLEEWHICNSCEEGVRRCLTYMLKKEGYL
jgi:hypothetical protein